MSSTRLAEQPWPDQSDQMARWHPQVHAPQRFMPIERNAQSAHFDHGRAGVLAKVRVHFIAEIREWF